MRNDPDRHACAGSKRRLDEDQDKGDNNTNSYNVDANEAAGTYISAGVICQIYHMTLNSFQHSMQASPDACISHGDTAAKLIMRKVTLDIHSSHSDRPCPPKIIYCRADGRFCTCSSTGFCSSKTSDATCTEAQSLTVTSLSASAEAEADAPRSCVLWYRSLGC